MRRVAELDPRQLMQRSVSTLVVAMAMFLGCPTQP
jgi:hypothetical protein